MAKTSGLGRGLSALMDDSAKQAVDSAVSLVSQKNTFAEQEVDVSLLVPNPFQPRTEFDREKLQELAESISEHGIIQPIVVEKCDDGRYSIIAGERRTRAARLAGLKTVPVVVRSYSDERKLAIALIENIQRADLNPVEEAKAFRQMMDMSGITQDEVAKRVGKNRSTITNSIRLLKLPEDMLGALAAGQISAGHARALLSVVNPADQRILFGRILGSGMSVRDAERSAADLNDGGRAAAPAKAPLKSVRKDPVIADIEQKFIDVMGTKVTVKGSLDRGSIVIDYFSREDLDRLYGLFDTN